jgi:hypothetical protein
MDILGLPNEIINHIVYYLNMRDIRNLKLSNYELSEKIGDYNLDLQQVLRCLIKIDIYWNMKDLIYNNIRKTICGYDMYFEVASEQFIDNMYFEVDNGQLNDKNVLAVEICGLKNVGSEMENKLYELGFTFTGCVNIVTEDMLYSYTFGDVNNETLERIVTDKLEELYENINIYQTETSHSIMQHLIYRNKHNIYNELSNIKHMKKLSLLELYKLHDYILRKQIKVVYIKNLLS